MFLSKGADLCHIICDEDAATAIKSYSPDIIVHPYIKIRATANLQDEKKSNAIWAQTFDDIGELLKRIHVLVVGPGLSRDRQMLQCAKHAIEKAKELEIPIVIDAVSEQAGNKRQFADIRMSVSGRLWHHLMDITLTSFKFFQRMGYSLFNTSQN